MLFFPFLSSTAKTTQLILMHDGCYDAVSCKEVFLGVRKFEFSIQLIFSKNKKYSGTYGNKSELMLKSSS